MEIVKEKKSKKEKSEKSEKSKKVKSEKVEYKFISSEDAKKYSNKELEDKIKELEKKAEELSKQLKDKKYVVKFKDVKYAKEVLKYIEKNIKWNYSFLGIYIATVRGLKEAINNYIKDKRSDGIFYLGVAPLDGLYQSILQVSGEGYYEAEKFLKVILEVNEGISDAMKEMSADHELLRNIHTDLATLDQEKVARSQGIKVEESVKSETNKK